MLGNTVAPTGGNNKNGIKIQIKKDNNNEDSKSSSRSNRKVDNNRLK